jgi:predicted  nucleic acid-binding Zn-ribbon protein
METSTSTLSGEQDAKRAEIGERDERQEENAVLLRGLRKELGPLTDDQLARVKEDASNLIDDEIAILVRSNVTLSYQIAAMHNTVTKMQNRIEADRRRLEKLRIARLKLKL